MSSSSLTIGGIGFSTDNGRPFDVEQLADDAARVIEALGIERTNLLGWSMGGFIAQTLALQHPAVLTNSSYYRRIRAEPTQISPQPMCGRNSSICPERLMNRRVDYCHCFFRGHVAESIYREFGDIVAAARAQLSTNLVNRQVAAMDAWHRCGHRKPAARDERALC